MTDFLLLKYDIIYLLERRDSMYKKLLMIMMVLILSGCIKEHKVVEEPKKDVEPVEEIEEVPSYVDDNTFPISFYKSQSGVLYKLTEVKESFVSKKDITTVQVFPSNEESIKLTTDKGNAFNNKWIELDANHAIKQGFNISYTLKDGTLISQNIMGPSTTQTNYDYIEIYLYDAYAHRNDNWYSHIEENQMNDATYFTSIKLTAGSKVADIVSKIKLTTFTYDTQDDFLESGDYRGASSYSIEICDLNSTCDE